MYNNEFIMKEKPKTKKKCFAQLDEMLSETNKKAIAEAKDIIEFHFTLGLWIRNNWLYDRSEEELDSVRHSAQMNPILRLMIYLQRYWKHIKNI